MRLCHNAVPASSLVSGGCDPCAASGSSWNNRLDPFIYLESQSEVYPRLWLGSSYLTISVLMESSPIQVTEAAAGEDSVVFALIINY